MTLETTARTLEAPPRPSFEGIFRAEAPYVGRTLRYLGVREPYLEDACQEAFLVVHRRLPDFQGGSVRGWLRQICVHTAQNYRRSMGRRREDLAGERPLGVSDPEQHADLERRRLRDRLLAVLDGLPDEHRETFVLFEIERLTMAETAAALGCPLQTAYSRLHAARAKIRAAVGEEEL